MMPKIEKYVTETLGAEVLVRTTNQPQTAYAVAASLSKIKLKKILIYKMVTNKSINRLDTQKNLYNALVESYNSNKDIITSYGDVVLLKKGRDDQDKYENPSAGSDQGMKRRKSSKDAKSSKDSRSKSIHAEDPSHTVEESGMQQDQEFVTRDNDEQPVDKEVTKADWFKKSERPLTPDPDWSKRHQIDFQQPQNWINQAALAEEPPTSIDEFNDTSFDFSAFTKAATYELKWIEDLVPELWSLVVFKRKRLMCTDELYKFSDGTLNDVQTTLHDIAVGIRMDYLPMRKWSNLDKKMAWVMV
nr:hypothetical protein [Tanacetum cinerariifolium]